MSKHIVGNLVTRKPVVQESPTIFSKPKPEKRPKCDKKKFHKHLDTADFSTHNTSS